MSNTPPLYNETHQHRDATPTAYENLLGDSIESPSRFSYAVGVASRC